MNNNKPVLRAVVTREHYEQTFCPLRELEGWGACGADADLHMAQSKGKGFWAGYLGDEFFCTFSFIEYPDIKAAYFGSYATKREYRRKGLTYPLFKEKYDELKSRGYRLIFVADDSMIETYTKSMQVFPIGRLELMKIRAGDFQPKPMPRDCIRKGSEVPLDSLASYDKSICRYDRSSCINLFRTHPEVQCFVFLEGEQIKGYCVLKRNTTEYKIMPLLADSSEVARTLIEAAIEKVPQQEEVQIFCPHPARASELKELGFSTFECDYMMGEHPNDFERTYGIHAIDAGL